MLSARPQNSEIQTAAGITLIQPDSSRMRWLEQASNGRLSTYVFADISLVLANKNTNTEQAYHELVTQPLCTILGSTFAEDYISVRGIMTSLSDEQPVELKNGDRVRSITATLQNGEEQGVPSFMVNRFDATNFESIHYAANALLGASFRRATAHSARQEETLFPALLIYDDHDISSLGDYEVRIRDHVDKSQAIKAAYVLPAVKFEQH